MPLPDLMCLYWTNAGIVLGTGEISRRPFEDRVAAAAKAGFRGIGLWHTDLEHILVHRSLKEMRAILDDHGVRHLELEFLTDWFLEGGRRSESDRKRRMLLEASAALGASHVKVGDFYNTPATMPQLIDAFGALCAEAKTHGARIGFEFMASAMLTSLKDSLAMVEGAGAANGGVIVDIVHAVMLGISNAEIAAIPRQQLISVELNDGIPPGRPGHDPANRRFCGEGEFDIKGFIAAVRATGYDGPWALEVFSRDTAAMPLDELSTRAYATTAAAFTD